MKKITDFLISSLTPENCPGYEYIDQTFYDEDLPEETTDKELIRGLAAGTYKLGELAGGDMLMEAGYVGVYKKNK